MKKPKDPLRARIRRLRADAAVEIASDKPAPGAAAEPEPEVIDEKPIPDLPPEPEAIEEIRDIETPEPVVSVPGPDDSIESNKPTGTLEWFLRR